MQFLDVFATLIRKFYYFCLKHGTSLYGVEHWILNNGRSKIEFYNLSVTFHNSLKKVLGFPRYENNHDVCAEAQIHTFKHIVNRKIILHVYNLMNSNSPCVIPLRSYFK
jgi:hypothetical protein